METDSDCCKMRLLPKPLVVPFILAICGVGCDRSDSARSRTPPLKTPLSESERQELLDAVAKAERDARNVKSPPPKITPVTPPGWSITETRPLPANDQGFTVAYEHESGLAVTLYQYTRGHAVIPNDLTSPLIQDEMTRAKNGIEQAVELGYWQSVKEKQSRKVGLGDSTQEALWSRYDLTVDGKTVTSEICVWAKANALFKLRCTGRTEDFDSDQTVLGPLLTAIGSSDTPDASR